MGWYKPFNELDAKQINVRDAIMRALDRSHWIRGFAGTGKTLILTHAIERVAALHPNASLCYVTYTHALKDMVLSGLHGPVAERIVVMTHAKFLWRPQRYDYVFLDEVQDIAPMALARIRKLAGTVVVAGDPEQSIYENGASEGEITQALEPQQWQLLQIFRLTDLLRRVAHAILPSSKIVEGQMANTDSNVTIRMASFASGRDEVCWVWDQASSRAVPGSPATILFPTHDAIAAFMRALAAELGREGPDSTPQDKRYEHFNAYWADMGLQYFGNGHGSLPETERKPMVCLMTFHSSKGLDFENVFIPKMDEEAEIVSEFAREKDPELERRLLFVAVTRSRKNLFITYHGARPHRLLQNLPAEATVSVQKTKARIGATMSPRQIEESAPDNEQDLLF